MRLGITGGIGSGKTIVCRLFSILGVPVFSADEVAGSVMENNHSIIDLINSAVGKNVYKNGKLQRSELASLIFNNKNLLEKINSIVHPEVFRNFNEWVKTQDFPYVIMEAAILFESGADKYVDRILTVVAPEQERIRRVVERNKVSEREVIERIRNQYNEKFLTDRSDYIINNSGNNLIIPEVIRIHEEMLKLSSLKKK